MTLLLWMSLAWGAELHVVRDGQTVESVAADLGDPDLAVAVRADNGLEPGAQPQPGDVLVLPATAPGTDQPAQVLATSGTGTVTPSGGTAQPLSVGLFLPAGAQVCTNADSFATVRLASIAGCGDEDDVTLLPDTCLVVDGNHARIGQRTSLVTVSSGAVAVRANQGQGRVAVRTPAGITTGEQGGFRVAVEEVGTRSEAVTGAVAVLAQGTDTSVPAGFGVRTPDGQVPGDLVKLLPPGSPTLPAPDARLTVPDFAWTPVDRALGYRVELSTDPDFTRLVRRSEVGRPTWEPTQLFLPYQGISLLHWRVVPFDRLGFEGIPSQGRRVNWPRGVGE